MKTKKEVIFETAKHLYYRDGFASTSFDDIAKAAGVKKTLVQYHFVTKGNLGSEIYGAYSMDQFNAYAAKARMAVDGITFPEIMFAYTLKTIEYYGKDERAFRFYCEFYSSALELEVIKLKDIINYAGLPEGTDLDYVHAVYISTQYALRGVIYHYIKGGIRLGQDAFEKFLTEVLALKEIFGVRDADALLKNVHRIEDAVCIEFKDDFIWE